MRALSCRCLFVASMITCLAGWLDAAEPAKKADRADLGWAWQSPVRPAVPPVKYKAWARNPIDAFILAELEKAGRKPSPEADKVTLVRRLYFDLIGLPPTPEAVDAFVRDGSPDAYEKLVDRLLAMPQHGERWATFWLDLVRYAETDGFRADDLRPQAWRYRDYVVRSLNADKPYDRFIQEQLAGDELFPGDAEALVATGFLRHYPDEFNAVNLEQRRQEILNDITDTTAQVFLGLTLGCARCHDHKFDPIYQVDYYRFQAFFAGWNPSDVMIGSKEEREKYEQKKHEWEAKTADVRSKMAELEEPVKQKYMAQRRGRFSEEYQKLLDIPQDKRTPLQQQLGHLIDKQVKVSSDEMMKQMKPDAQKEYKELSKQMDEANKVKPSTLPAAMAFTDVGAETAPTFFLKRGDWRQKGKEIVPGYLSAIEEKPEAKISPKPEARTSGRRGILAGWLTSKDHPLTARVMVNRLWQHHFGQGIVASPSDFGVQGEMPTHPELLDWLANEFMSSSGPAGPLANDGLTPAARQAWSMKKMHRLMVTSATYRQASRSGPSAADPENRLLGRMNRRRLEGEALRDTLLAVSGLLNAKAGGPSIFPELPAELGGIKGWSVSPEPERHRRSVYVFVKRNMRYPFFSVFDTPEANESCARRNLSTNAPQALMLLNSKIVLDQARAFAGRVLRDAGGDLAKAAERAHRLALGRNPAADELKLLTSFLEKESALVRQRIRQKQPLLTPVNAPKDLDPALGAAVVDLCHALMNVNEFLYVD